jgi:pilus assembly protein FimV
MNRMKAGVVLSVPSADTAKAITRAKQRTSSRRRAPTSAPIASASPAACPTPRPKARPARRRQGPGERRGPQAGRRTDARQADAEQGRRAGSKVPAPEDKSRRNARSGRGHARRRAVEERRGAEEAVRRGLGADGKAAAPRRRRPRRRRATIRAPSRRRPPRRHRRRPRRPRPGRAARPHRPRLPVPARSAPTPWPRRPPLATPHRTAGSAPAIAAAPRCACARSVAGRQAAGAGRQGHAARRRAEPARLDVRRQPVGPRPRRRSRRAARRLRHLSLQPPFEEGQRGDVVPRKPPAADSFFGASGGQRIDTRDAGGARRR